MGIFQPKYFDLFFFFSLLDARSTGDQEVAGLIPRLVRQHCFVEIDHEIFPTVIIPLLPIPKGSCQILAKEFAQILVNC